MLLRRYHDKQQISEKEQLEVQQEVKKEEKKNVRKPIKKGDE